MRKKMWSAGLIIGILISTTLGDISSAQAPQHLQPSVKSGTGGESVSVQAVQTDEPSVSAVLIDRVAAITEFADWHGADVRVVREFHAPTGEKNARLWRVGSKQQELGYLVTDQTGQHLYEFSRRPLPDMPQDLQSRLLQGGFIYSGPMMHLAYVEGAEGLELYNLFTGEFMPAGELVNFVPAFSETDDAVKPDGNTALRERHLPHSTRPEVDALNAAGHYGQHQIAQTEGVLSLRAFLKESAGQNTLQQKAFVVYDAIPNKLFVSLMMSKIVQQENVTYIGLQDPFAGMDGAQEQPLVYIDSRFDVPVVLPGPPSAQ